MFQLTQNDKKTLCVAMRTLIYFVILLATSVGIWQLAHICGSDAFSENGLVENVQCVLLIVSMVILSVVTWKHSSMRIVSFGLMSLCILGLCREQDAWFDGHLPILSWRVGYFFPATVLCYGLWHMKTFVHQIVAFLRTPSFALMFCAMVMIIPFAQCIGHKPLIVDVVDQCNSSAIIAIRRMIEESGELLGYLMLVLAALELIFDSKKR